MTPLQTLLVDNGGRKPKWYQVLLQAILPIIITTLLIWGADRVHQMDKTLAVVVHMVTDTNAKLEQHHLVTKDILSKNSDLHHSRLMKTPCTGCHVGK